MKKTLKRLLVVTLALTMFASLTMGVSAASLKDLFDADYYLEQYPDLQKVLGNDKDALYDHYIKFGLKEGRNASTLFDVNKYREMYPDLDAAFGDNWEGYVEHYLNFGIKEERDGGGEFDAVSYAKRYPDVYEAYGLDISKLKAHYDAFGKAEKREAISQAVVEEREASSSSNTEATIDTAKFATAAMHLNNLASYYRSYNEILNDENLEESEKFEQSATYVELYNETYPLFAAARDAAVANMTYDESIYWHDLFDRITAGSGLSVMNLPEFLALG